MKPPKIPRKLLGLPNLPKRLSLDDLRFRRDLASRDGDLKLALACAIAIDKKKGLY